jgi:type VI protein secretion system component Hcp
VDESFLKIPGIAGDARDSQHAGWIPLRGVSVREVLDKPGVDSGIGGQSEVRRDATVTRILGDASPDLEVARRWEAVTIELVTATGKRTITLEDAVIVGSQDQLIADGATKFWGQEIHFTFARQKESSEARGAAKPPGLARATGGETRSFLQVPDISGDAKDARHAAWIQLRGLDDLQANPAKTKQDHVGERRIPDVVPVSDGKDGQVTVLKDADSASTSLLKAFEDHSQFPQITIEVVGDRAQKINLKNVVIIAIGVQKDSQAERITFSYGERALGESPKSASKDEAQASAADGDEGSPQQTSDVPADGGPVGAGEYIVEQGECVSSIAKDTGHFWQTLWDEPTNAELRKIRKDPNVLLPGDRVYVPPLQQKMEAGQTEMRHRFRLKSQPEMLRIRVLRDGKPRKNQPYTLDVDGKVRNGTTDADGKVECPILPNARRAVLQVGSGLDVEEHEFELGAIDPITETSGVQGRLNNLGFDCGAVDGKWGPQSERALRKFQALYGLPESGVPDEATREQLQSTHGC